MFVPPLLFIPTYGVDAPLVTILLIASVFALTCVSNAVRLAPTVFAVVI